MPATLFALRSVVLDPAVQSKLCQLAFGAFTSRPGEGEIIDGVLLGQIGRDGVEVTDLWQGTEDRKGIVGFWSIRRKVSQTWERAGGPGVYLVVAPVSVQCAEALVWQREADGAESEARAMVIRVGRRASERSKRHQGGGSPAGASSFFSRSWRWPVTAAVTAALAILAVWLMPAFLEAEPASLELSLQGAGETVQVQWREKSHSGPGRLQSAALVVRQGQREETLDLMDQYGPEGQLAVPLEADEVVISLRVRRAGQAAATQTATYVSPGPGQAKRNGAELEWLRFRNRELEEKVAALQARN